MLKLKIGIIAATFILLLISVFLLIFFGNKVKTQTLEYEEVEVTVISAEKVKLISGARNSTSHINKVIVVYEGVRYELQSVNDMEMVDYEIKANAQNEADTENSGILGSNGYISDGKLYSNDTTATVYLYNGQLYSNASCIKTNTPAFQWRQVGLFGTCIFSIFHLLCVASLIDEKIKLKKETKQKIGGN